MDTMSSTMKNMWIQMMFDYTKAITFDKNKAERLRKTRNFGFEFKFLKFKLRKNLT